MHEKGKGDGDKARRTQKNKTEGAPNGGGIKGSKVVYSIEDLL